MGEGVLLLETVVRVVLEPAFILHSRAFQETSLILDVFTANYGRVSLIAKGARTQRSPFRGFLRLFLPLLVSWSGKTELMKLTQVEYYGQPSNQPGEHLLYGFYLNELLVRLLPRLDAHPHIFASYQHTLKQLTKETFCESILRLFEKDLLSELGYGLSLDKEILNGEAITADQNYIFIPGRGLSKYSNIEQTAHPRVIFSGRSLLALHYGKFENKQDLYAAKQLMRVAVGDLLGERPLKSRELFG